MDSKKRKYSDTFSQTYDNEDEHKELLLLKEKKKCFSVSKNLDSLRMEVSILKDYVESLEKLDFPTSSSISNNINEGNYTGAKVVYGITGELRDRLVKCLYKTRSYIETSSNTMQTLINKGENGFCFICNCVVDLHQLQSCKRNECKSLCCVDCIQNRKNTIFEGYCYNCEKDKQFFKTILAEKIKPGSTNYCNKCKFVFALDGLNFCEQKNCDEFVCDNCSYCELCKEFEVYCRSCDKQYHKNQLQEPN